MCGIYFLIILLVLPGLLSIPEQGKFDFIMTKDRNSVVIQKTLFAGSRIGVQINCNSNISSTIVEISWSLTQRICWLDDDNENYLKNEVIQIKPKQIHASCITGSHIFLPEVKFNEQKESSGNDKDDQNKKSDKETVTEAAKKSDNIIYRVVNDGLYKFEMQIKPLQNNDFISTVHIEMKGDYGYLSAADWPLLPFYGAMCLVYLFYGIVWLIVSSLQWRDLLRIQFWIGGVILLGMVEKAAYYGEYQSVNYTGVSLQGAELIAVWVSCAKRTLARMLVIIVSLGFGFVKPRLGAMLHRVVGTGTLYFVLACVEGYLRVVHEKNYQNNQILVASIPLAVLDSAICWWIFTSLVQTTRTLRLRRNMVKISLYQHFTNTLIFAVVASVLFMLYSIKVHNLTKCSPNWREAWIDDAFWHVLFSVLLLVIMILWRPTNNNQRYAFTPLLDNPEDEDDDDEEEQFVSDAYGVKMRGSHTVNSKNLIPKASTTEDEDLRWVEDNIPSAISESTLPVLDSDEEILNTKFEVSKMQ